MTRSQGNLFGVNPAGYRDVAPPYQPHSATSQAAAVSMEGKTGTERRRVYDFLLERKLSGATDEEMQRGLQMNPSTQRPRRVELVKGGLVVDTGKTRKTASGRKATVWTVVG